MAAIPIEIAWDFPNENKGTPLGLVLFEIFYWTSYVQNHISSIPWKNCRTRSHFKGKLVWLMSHVATVAAKHHVYQALGMLVNGNT
eukprot:420141-Amphidinium_carterae.1